MRVRRLIASALLSVGLAPAAAETPSECEHVMVESETMREVIHRISGYDTAAITNQSRFVADFLFGLASHPDVIGRASSFQVQPERFFQAWLEVSGLQAGDAPVSMRKALDQGQRFIVEVDAPITLSPDSLTPERVLNVRASWPDAPDAEEHYSYHDTLSRPAVRLRHEQTITYQLVDFGDFVAFENMDGIRGQPTSGGLGALFSVLGMAEIRQSRFAVGDDQVQVNRSKVKKLFSFTALTTITPEGVAQRDIPPGRSDLRALAELLETEINVEAQKSPPRACDL